MGLGGDDRREMREENDGQTANRNEQSRDCNGEPLGARAVHQ